MAYLSWKIEHKLATNSVKSSILDRFFLFYLQISGTNHIAAKWKLKILKLFWFELSCQQLDIFL